MVAQRLREREGEGARGTQSGELKVILLGDSAVGKSKLVERFLLQEYKPQQMSTFALTLFRHTYRREPGGEEVGVNIWDTAGQERFESVHPSYFHRADAAILVFDVTRKVTYKSLRRWLGELREYSPGTPAIVVANKIDVDRRVASKEFDFPKRNNLPCFFTSAADGTNAVRIFHDAFERALHFRSSPAAHEGDVVREVMDILDEVCHPPPCGPFPSLLDHSSGAERRLQAEAG